MTATVVRTLDESSAHLFGALPDPRGFREKHRRTRYRPDWKRAALRDGRVVARAAWWGRPEDPEPLVITRLGGEDEASGALGQSVVRGPAVDEAFHERLVSRCAGGGGAGGDGGRG